MSPSAASRKSFRIALVGCGRISRNHFDAIARVDGLELSAVCDTIPERARAAGEEQGVPWFTNYQEMLTTADADAVAICTPSGLHAAHGIAAGTQPVADRRPVVAERAEHAAAGDDDAPAHAMPPFTEITWRVT